jgi:hypothetical protein
MSLKNYIFLTFVLISSTSASIYAQNTQYESNFIIGDKEYYYDKTTTPTTESVTFLEKEYTVDVYSPLYECTITEANGYVECASDITPINNGGSYKKVKNSWDYFAIQENNEFRFEFAFNPYIVDGESFSIIDEAQAKQKAQEKNINYSNTINLAYTKLNQNNETSYQFILNDTSTYTPTGDLIENTEISFPFELKVNGANGELYEYSGSFNESSESTENNITVSGKIELNTNSETATIVWKINENCLDITRDKDNSIITNGCSLN